MTDIECINIMLDSIDARMKKHFANDSQPEIKSLQQSVFDLKVVCGLLCEKIEQMTRLTVVK
jgi:hypothetical protein